MSEGAPKPLPKVPDYIDGHLSAIADRGISEPPSPSDLFMHLGYWRSFEGGAEKSDLRAAQERLNDRILQLANIRHGQRIVDVGCGLGGTICAIDKVASNLRLIGVNIDARQLEVARTRVVPTPANQVEWVLSDACALPFEGASVDRVLAVECAFHFASRRRFLAETARVLRAEGLLVLSDFMPSPTFVEARERGSLPKGLESALTEALSPCEGLFRTEGTYDEMAAAEGLVAVETEDATLSTLPSFTLILGNKTLDFDSPGAKADDRGVAALAWAFLRGLFRVEIRSFRRSAPPRPQES